MHREFDAWADELSGLIDPDVPADEILTEMGRRDAAFVEERPLVADLLSGAHDDELPAWRERFEARRGRGLRHVIEVLQLGREQGLFADDLEVPATARVLQDMQLTGAFLRHRTDLGIRQVRRQQRAALRLVLDGLRARPASRTTSTRTQTP